MSKISMWLADSDNLLPIVVIALVVVVALWLIQESPQDAYERGFEEGRGQRDYGFALGYIQGGFDDIAGFDIRLGADGSLVLAWEKDMVWKFNRESYYGELKLFIDDLTAIYHLRAEADSMATLLDSTDTMPAVEAEHDN